MKGFLRELNERRVTRVAIAYLVFAWVVLQIADIVLPAMGLPDWAMTVTLVLLVVFFPVALVLSWIFDITPEGIERTDKPATNLVPGERSVAVLPFPDLSPERDQQHFCDGLTDELIHVLSRIPGLRVASRRSSFALRGQEDDLKTVAEKLKVTHVLEGSVRKDGGMVRVSAQLTRADNDSVLWSNTYDRELCDVLAIQGEIARCIMQSMQLKLTPGSYLNPVTDNPRAYEYYLRGRGHFITNRELDLARARELFEKAVEVDPNFVSAWILLAEVCAVQAIFLGGGKPAQDRAAEAGEKALELAPDSGSSHMAYGFGQLACSCYDDAEAALLKAVELDPSLVRAWHYLGRNAHHQGKIEDETHYYMKAAELDESDWESPILVIAALKALGDTAAVKKAAGIAVARIERHLEDYPDNPRAYYLGVGALFHLGKMEKAREWAVRALELAADDPPTRYNLACFYAQAGESEKALDLLEGSIQSRSWIENDHDLDPLREHPRYRAFIETLAD